MATATATLIDTAFKVTGEDGSTFYPFQCVFTGTAVTDGQVKTPANAGAEYGSLKVVVNSKPFTDREGNVIKDENGHPKRKALFINVKGYGQEKASLAGARKGDTVTMTIELPDMSATIGQDGKAYANLFAQAWNVTVRAKNSSNQSAGSIGGAVGEDETYG
jgi:hypothetical protein